MLRARLSLSAGKAVLTGTGLPPGLTCRFDLRRYSAEGVVDFEDQRVPIEEDGSGTATWPIDGVPAPSAWIGSIWSGSTLLTSIQKRV